MAPGFKCLVLDSNILIKGAPTLFQSGEVEYFTVPGVVSEIANDVVAQQRYNNIKTLYNITVQTPQNHNLAKVIAFARKTGDYASLSMVDLQVLALQYEIEVDYLNGGITPKYIRAEPKRKLGTGTKTLHESIKQKYAAGDSNATNSNEDTTNDVEVGTTLNNLDENIQEECVTDEGKETLEKEAQDVTKDTDNSFTPDQEKVAPTSWAGLFASKTPFASKDTDTAPLDLTSPFGQMAIVDNHHDEIKEVTDTEDESSSDGLILEEDFPVLALTAEEKENIARKLAAEEVMKASKNNCKPDGKKIYASFNQYRDLVRGSGAIDHALGSKKGSVANDEKRIDEYLKNSQIVADAEEESKVDLSQTRIMGVGTTMAENVAVEDFDDDGEGWVTPQNFKTQDHTFGTKVKGVSSDANNRSNLDQDRRCACATTDFAMQNVILQMGLKLVSVEGMQVKRVKQWVIRCGACHIIYGNKEEDNKPRLFCSRCGSDFMERIAASVDGKTGRYILHLSKKHKHQLRGTKFSLPKPGKGNRFEGDLLLREDQLMSGIWNQKVKRGSGTDAGAVKSIFGADITAGVGLGDLSKRNDINIGFGKRNPNSAKFGRERRGKKKKNANNKACGLRRY